MRRFMTFWLPEWERMDGHQRAVCVDFGLSVSLTLLSGCSSSFLLALLCGVNLLRSWLRLRDSGVRLDD